MADSPPKLKNPFTSLEVPSKLTNRSPLSFFAPTNIKASKLCWPLKACIAISIPIITNGPAVGIAPGPPPPLRLFPCGIAAFKFFNANGISSTTENTGALIFIELGNPGTPILGSAMDSDIPFIFSDLLALVSNTILLKVPAIGNTVSLNPAERINVSIPPEPLISSSAKSVTPCSIGFVFLPGSDFAKSVSTWLMFLDKISGIVLSAGFNFFPLGTNIIVRLSILTPSSGVPLVPGINSLKPNLSSVTAITALSNPCGWNAAISPFVFKNSKSATNWSLVTVILSNLISSNPGTLLPATSLAEIPPPLCASSVATYSTLFASSLISM